MHARQKSPPRENAAKEPAQCLTKSPIRILVVDDDEVIRRINALVLRRFGFQTETAEDGEAAWEALQANGFDLLVTDHNMPRLTGVDLVRKVRGARLKLPVILASRALPTEEVQKDAGLQPMLTLAKPFSGFQLLHAVNELIPQPALPVHACADVAAGSPPGHPMSG